MDGRVGKAQGARALVTAASAATLGILAGLGLWSSGALPTAALPPDPTTEGSPAARSDTSAALDPADSRRDRAQVAWLEWGPAAFQRAKEEDKLVFLDLTAVWCHACHVMDETTYVDPTVVELLNHRYVPVRVDTDRRPDIDVRYREGGWPTTSILLHTGEILFQANFLEADQLVAALEEADGQYRSHRAELFERAAAAWAQVEAATRSMPSAPASSFEGVPARSASVLQLRFDPEHGGFRKKPKFFEPDAITFAFRYAYWTGDESFKTMALETLDQQVRLLDPVWGGFYRYAEEADWSKPHEEKLLDVQARNLWNYLEAFQATGKATYRSVAEEVITYVNHFLLRPDRTGFYASQAAGAKSGRAKTLGSSTGARVPPVDEGRDSGGLPPVDRTVYTGPNALMAASYLQASSVLERPGLRRVALKVLDHLYRERYVRGRGVAHAPPVTGGEPLFLLGDQVSMARALVEAFLTTSGRSHLRRAERIAAVLVAQFGDEAGGYLDRADTAAEGLLRLPQKPLRDNLRAAMLFSDLFYLTAQPRYRAEAERTLGLVLGGGAALPVAQVGLAVDRFLRYPLHIVVVGQEDDSLARELFGRAQRVYVPGKMVRWLDPTRDDLKVGGVTFPENGRPTAYVCTDHFCSTPFARPEQIEQRVALVVSTVSGERPGP